MESGRLIVYPVSPTSFELTLRFQFMTFETLTPG
jgi:hypothetical protein